MSECVKETLCTRCEHRIVCKYKEDYLKIIESVNNASVCLKDEDGKHCMKKVTDYDFIEEIKVRCKYYSCIYDNATISTRSISSNY